MPAAAFHCAAMPSNSLRSAGRIATKDSRDAGCCSYGQKIPDMPCLYMTKTDNSKTPAMAWYDALNPAEKTFLNHTGPRSKLMAMLNETYREQAQFTVLASLLREAVDRLDAENAADESAGAAGTGAST